jgi:hypothetical protein
MTELNSDLDRLRWLVPARNKIQAFLLELHEVYARKGSADPDPSLRDLHFMLGAAFSLWRAVFLVQYRGDFDKPRTNSQILDDAKSFLRKVIETNAIAFGDDLERHGWTCGYYLNNARERIKRLGGQFPAGISNANLKEEWDQTYEQLRQVFEAWKSGEHASAPGAQS